jgi:hypothetical protein
MVLGITGPFISRGHRFFLVVLRHPPFLCASTGTIKPTWGPGPMSSLPKEEACWGRLVIWGPTDRDHFPVL